MTSDRAQTIADQFTDAVGYRVEADSHGLLVTEFREDGRDGRTSYFQREDGFFRFIESVVVRLFPLPSDHASS